MKDKIFEMFFDKQRWENALAKGLLKGINQKVIRKYMSPEGRQELMLKIAAGEYVIERPHTAKIPKDTPGEFRTVFVNENEDRIFLSIANDLLFEIAGDMVHKSCTSYQTGLGCGKVVKEASEIIDRLSGVNHKVIGWKADLSKYFDSVPIQFIDKAFDEVEKKHGHSLIIDVIRQYYHNDKYYDSETRTECEKFQSLKQGCAVAAWLADVVLYHIDEQLSKMDGFYVRYSDDTLFIGKDYGVAMVQMSNELEAMNMKLNPKKVEPLTNDRWFKFLGFSIKGSQISLSGKRIKTFQNEVANRTYKRVRDGWTFKQALHSVQSWLYCGDGSHSWATGVLGIINVEKDISQLNNYVIDCLRAVLANKKVKPSGIGGLGWCLQGNDGCIVRGKGSKVRKLRNSTDKILPDYYTLKCMKNALLYGRDVYDSIIREI